MISTRINSVSRGFAAPHAARSARLAVFARAAPSTQETTTVSETIAALDTLLPPEAPKQEAAAPAPSSSGRVVTPAAPVATPWNNLPSLPSKPASSNRKAGSVDFTAVMGFEGLAPELINGRAAMLGFVAALANEVHGDSLFGQLMSGGAGGAAAVIAVVIAASFAPALLGTPLDRALGAGKEPTSLGPFTPLAERLNGRAAMLGLAALFFIEGTGGQPFFL